MSSGTGDGGAPSEYGGSPGRSVVDAAAHVVDSQGLDDLTFVGLAETMGVEPAALYNKVSSLDALRAALTYRAFRELGEALAAATEGYSGSTAVVKLALAYRLYAQQHPGLYETLLRALRTGDSSTEYAAGSIIELIAGVLHGYGLEGDDAVHAARALRSALHGFVALEVGDGFTLPQGVDESFESLVELLLGGLESLAAGKDVDAHAES